MRSMRMGLRWLGVALLLAGGCTTTEPDLRPPPRPEEYTVPPLTDARFSQPPKYAEDSTSTAPNKRSGDPSPLSDPTRFRAGRAGMGGGGY